MPGNGQANTVVAINAEIPNRATAVKISFLSDILGDMLSRRVMGIEAVKAFPSSTACRSGHYVEYRGAFHNRAIVSTSLTQVQLCIAHMVSNLVRYVPLPTKPRAQYLSRPYRLGPPPPRTTTVEVT